MASGKAAAPTSQEYVVRVPKDTRKKYSILKFHHSLNIDLTKSGPLKMGRENNLKEYRQAHDLDSMPKFGAGSEFGREQREEARRKKYGIYRKKYNPEDQPWLMTLGEGKQCKKFKGVKEGGIADNVSYFVFTQCPDGAFEACPIEEWYHFTPQATHRCLTAEEAEEEFSRRDQTLNYFSIMVRKRMKNDEEAEEVDETEKKIKKSKKKDFLLTELDEWGIMSDDDMEDDEEDGLEGEKRESKDKSKKQTKKSKNEAKTNSDDEALEESDSFDEGQEVDYITGSESNDEDMYEEKNRDEQDKYKEQGVEDEEGLKVLVESGDEEEEEAKEEEQEEEEGSRDAKEKKDNNDSDSDSSESSGSESDPEKEVNFSPLFMQKKKEDRKKAIETEGRSRSATPTEEKAKKRKIENETPAAKKVRVESTLTHSASSSSLSSEGITEEAVRRYLLRKPMTTKDLVQKFKNTGLSKDQLVNTIAKILKRIDPEKTKIKDKLYLSIKKTD